MKTTLRAIMVLVAGILTFSGSIAQKTSPEYDDLYYLPSDKAATAVEVQDVSRPELQEREPSDYEKYINSLENQRYADPQTYSYDDTLDYKNDKNFIESQYQEKDGNTYITNNYYNSDDYGYTSRIKRFYDPFYSSGYYDMGYYDPYRYQPGWSFGLSFGYPYSGFGFSYGWPYYSYWDPFYYSYYPYYSSWYYSPWGYNSYYYGYYNGFYDGYYYGYNGYNDVYYPNSRPVYYGPRRAIASSRSTAGSTVKSSSSYRSAQPVSSSTSRSTAATRIATSERIANPSTSRTVVKAGQDSPSSATSAGSAVRRPVTSTTESAVRSYSNPADNVSTQRKVTESTSTPSVQDRPVYTRPGTTTPTQSRPSYSGTPGSTMNTETQNRTSTYSRPATTPTSPSYTQPGGNSSSAPSFSRPSGNSSPAPSYSSPAQRSSAPAYTPSSRSSSSYSAPSSSGSGSSSGRSSAPSSSSGSSGSPGRR